MMPSGAKRRKAAKKKKEKEANLDLAINDSLGIEDVKSQDEKGSDGGELISPSSRDNDNHQTSFNGVEKSDQPPVLQNVAEEDTTNVISAETAVVIKNDPKSYDNFQGKMVSLNHTESAKKSKEEKDGSSSSSSSSSEEESHVKDSKSAGHDLVLKTNSCNNGSDNSPAEVIQVSDIAPVNHNQIEVTGNSSLPSNSAAEKTIPEDSQSQPLVAAAPQMAQRTSIFSCCGLFDALAGSNR